MPKHRRFIALTERIIRLHPQLTDPDRAVIEGRVRVNGVIITNTRARIPYAAAISISPPAAPLRGARKLAAALAAFSVPVAGRVALDVGASAGGFTQGLLAAGAGRVYAVDAGHGQLLGSLRLDGRVVNLERTNIASLSRTLVPDTIDLVVPVEGIAVGELEFRAFGDSDLRGNNPGMVRWGYVSLGPAPGDSLPKPPVSDWLVRPTDAGLRAQEIWRPLPSAVEKRWTERYRRQTMQALRRSLGSLVEQVEVELPDYLPTNGGHSGRADIEFRPARAWVPDSIDLSALLAKALLAFTVDFEQESALSLVMSANPLRVLDTEPIANRDLPRLTGVAKETLSVMLGALARRGYVVMIQDGRTKTAALTALGQTAQRNYHDVVRTIEQRWCSRYGSDVVTDLRAALETLVGDTMLARSPLAAAVEPPAGGWRAKVARPQVLPHHPVVSHRGGYPDGS